MLVFVLTVIEFRVHTNGEYPKCEISKKTA
jgi:hypothetical protein